MPSVKVLKQTKMKDRDTKNNGVCCVQNVHIIHKNKKYINCNAIFSIGGKKWMEKEYRYSDECSNVEGFLLPNHTSNFKEITLNLPALPIVISACDVLFSQNYGLFVISWQGTYIDICKDAIFF